MNFILFFIFIYLMLFFIAILKNFLNRENNHFMCAMMIILSTTINSFLKIDERSIVRIRKALENRTNMEDDRVSLLEQQLAQAKLIAEEADKKYEEVGHQRTKSEKNKG